ncbi:hypothetical protein OKE80_09830 [Riemerella anatipestifer]|uniref:Uncharacterized protein n=1 Tax=Riemerella anatipestifer TaxID=34085 RepID=A0AAP3AM75_RIEAN|nr:hypothetical protein [Riemerella anatipestifer]MCO7319620.1 hypothetical protein [Riemerella anatipestifer]MCU7568995.1 hypothetical protein [Riemerella anatipestifer]MCW0475114.1 hypothetical protein [Riemerella anatipestifer]MCW0490931.1 hypothetical protein [Riemerella anatipestifer]MCW0524503.1 hypothetical protein [Riemerella anatipestifer]
MKKLFSLITSIIVSACINAQVFQENFNDINGTGGNDGVFSGNVASAPLNSYGDWTLTELTKLMRVLK